MSEVLYVITGHFGSGKTELAVNLALRLAAEGKKTALADLDIVNPYFCSRERRALLERNGVQVVLPSGGGYIDLPSVSAEVLSILENEDTAGVLDVGGDPEGARVLGRFLPYLEKRETKVICVVNANRPETKDLFHALKHLRGIETCCGLKVNGLVNNTHLLGETTEADVRKGDQLTAALSKETGIPFLYSMADEGLLGTLSRDGLAAPLLPVRIYMRRPWEPQIK